VELLEPVQAPMLGLTNPRQKVLVLYLSSSALDAPVVAWAFYDGSGERLHMAGDEDKPPYGTGLDALRDGWRLFQASQLLPHARGEEFDLSYLKYEFFFERLVEAVR
jgi:hypothetical protein